MFGPYASLRIQSIRDSSATDSIGRSWKPSDGLAMHIIGTSG